MQAGYQYPAIDWPGAWAVFRDGLPSFGCALISITLIYLLLRGAGPLLWAVIAPLAGLLDRIIGVVSILVGARWRRVWLRWAHLLTVSALVAAALAAAPTSGAVAAFVAGLLLILAVLREWSQSERDDASGSTPWFLRSRLWEAIFAASMLFLIAPMGLSRLDRIYHLFPDPHGSMLVDMARNFVGRTGAFAWWEVPHSVPIVHAVAPEGNPFQEGGANALVTCAMLLRLSYELLVVGVFVDVLHRNVERLAAERTLKPQREALATGDEETQIAAVESLQKLAMENRRDAIDLLEQATSQTFPGTGNELGFYTRSRAALALLDVAEAFNSRSLFYLVEETFAELIHETAPQGDGESDRRKNWALACVNRAYVLVIIAEREGGQVRPHRLEEAMTAITDALHVYDQTSTPDEWALAQTILAYVLENRGELEESGAGIAQLEEAIRILASALAVMDRVDNPRVWANAQIRLGRTRANLGSRLGGETGKALLIDAKAAFLEVIEVEEIFSSYPSIWAEAQTSLGDALHDLGLSEAGDVQRKTLEDAVKAHKAALDVATFEAFPAMWAWAQKSLGKTLTSEGEFLGGDQGKELIKEAVEAFKSALKIYTPANAADYWAEIQYNLGYAFWKLASEETDATQSDQLLKESVSALESALAVYERDVSPLNWAITMIALGAVRSTLAYGATDTPTIERYARLAVANFTDSLEVFTPEGAPSNWMLAQYGLGYALVLLSQYANSDEEPALLRRAVEALEASARAYAAAGDQESATRAADLKDHAVQRLEAIDR
jgi:tetratricopeptide (TPR) repeat protein